jgi:hypothetical protein
MVEIAFGILLALLILLCIPFLLRSIVAIVPVAGILLLVLFLKTEIGRVLVPTILMFVLLGAIAFGAYRLVERRGIRRRAERQTIQDRNWDAR